MEKGKSTTYIEKKNKNANNPASYRPISLTPSLSKVYDSVINSKITEIGETNNILPDCQFGFRHNHSSTHAIHKLLPDVNTLVSNGKLEGAALLDIEKAFDTIWLNGLLYKLNKMQFPKWLIFTIWDMIANKSFFVWD